MIKYIHLPDKLHYALILAFVGSVDVFLLILVCLILWVLTSLFFCLTNLCADL